MVLMLASPATLSPPYLIGKFSLLAMVLQVRIQKKTYDGGMFSLF